MFAVVRLKRILILVVSAIILISALGIMSAKTDSIEVDNISSGETPKKYIKWVEFNVPYSALEKAYLLDIKSYSTDCHYNWVELLSYLAAKYGGNFSRYKAKDMDTLTQKLKEGKTMAEITKDMKYYSYYNEAYSAILSGFLGDYMVETDSDGDGTKEWVKKYGLKVFSPIAKGYGFGHYDDFGDSRSYGYKRRHLGNDLLGSVGTPIIAVESGTIEAMGWNVYGGWRIGIRSFDGKRYYYYAHLRRNWPYNKTLKIGDTVMGGDVIGYLGMTGYSTKENKNNIKVPHLHFGMQLIFDESQKEGVNQIWIDVYNIINLLNKNKSAVYKDSAGEFFRKYNIKFEE